MAETLARVAIAQIVRGADDAFDPDGLWPAVEEWDSGGMRLPLTGLYAGAAASSSRSTSCASITVEER